ncbi:hypothetical protein MMYC01_204449 [Madurella mycetomatis]|uniref:Uncharacterized protein n=1 Tax=Madurella mycetomatis TaxID=100816 RepID=A0A175W6D2_9PEZI|nr:hypothetical protein MMYC01_204449 [Madurella mycetomatis]
MRNALGCAALGFALGLVDGKALKWSNEEPRWAPPRETLAYMLSLGSEPPVPTPAPRMPVPRELLARDSTDNTCAYITGDPTSPLYCATTARCVYNENNLHIGCCDDGVTNCPIWTTCFDRTESALYTTDNGFTLWCGQEQYPHCITHEYQDDIMAGYTVLGCAVAAGTGRVWVTPTTTLETSSDISTPSTSFVSDPTTDSGSTGPSSTDLAPPPPPPAQDSSSSSSSSAPVGAIVGGVVGGLAALGLIVLGTWALIRHNNNQKKRAAEAAAIAAVQQQSPHQPPPTAPAPAPSPMNPRMSQMTQVPMQGYYDPTKVASGQYSMAVSSPTLTNFSPPHSPAPPSGVYPMSEGGPPSPPPQQVYQGYGDAPPPQPPPPQPQPQPGQQFQGYHQHQQMPGPGPQQQVYGGGNPQATELPVERGDGEVRELQG